MSDPIPDTQVERVLFYGRVADVLDVHGADLGFTPTEIQDAQDDADGADTRLIGKKNAAAAAQSATAEFKTFDTAVEGRTRDRLKRMKSAPKVTPTIIELLDQAPGDPPAPEGAPQTAPIGFAKTLRGRRQEVSWSDETTPNTTRKPPGVKGGILYNKIGGEPPMSTSEMNFIAIDTASPYIYEFEPEDIGKTCYWKIVWYNSEGDGPDGETFSATIGE